MSIAGTNIEHYTLSNGLQVALVHDSNAGIVTVKTIIRAGSIHEGKHLGHGLSHYLEHLVSGGTTSVKSEDEYIKIQSLLGGVSNAYTTTDHTAYFINTSPEQASVALETIYEWMFKCTFKQSEVDREKEVITREIEKTQANMQRQHYYISQRNQYKTHPTKHPVIGYLDEFLQVTRDDLVNYYNAQYTPSNMILIIGGNFDEAAIKDQILNSFGQEKRNTPPTDLPILEKEPFNPRFVEEALNINSTFVSLRFATVDLYSEHLYDLDLLDYILGHGKQSILYKELVDKEELAYTLSTSSFTPAYANGYFEIYFECDYENKDKAIDKILSIIEHYKDKKFSDKLIKRSKQQKLADDILNINSIEDKSNKIAMSMLYANNPNFFKDYTEQFKDVDAKSVQNALKQFLNPDKLMTSISRPQSVSAQNNNKTIKDNAEQAEKITLDNGVRVILHYDNDLPKINAQIMSLGGLRYEDDTTNGIGHIISDLIGTKTSKLDKDDIDEIFEDHGANTEASLGNHTLYYNLDTLSEDSDQIIKTFFTTFFDFKVDNNELKKAKRILVNDIEQRDDSWFGEGSYKFKKQFYKGHAYSLSRLGEIESVNQINKDQIKDLFEQYLNPSRLVISVYGDFDKEAMIKQIKEATKSLSAETTSALQLKRPLHDSPSKEKETHSHQVSSLFIGFDGIDYSNPEELFKLDLVDAVLSGMSYPGGRLHKKLRDAGYVYVVHGQNFVGIEKGHFAIYALTNEESIQDAERIIYEEIEDIKYNKISEDEFEEAIQRMKFYYKDQASEVHGQLLVRSAIELYINDFDFYKKADDIISTLTVEDVMETAQKYLVNAQQISFHPKQ